MTQFSLPASIRQPFKVIRMARRELPISSRCHGTRRAG
jgi:hypothetical protein